MTPCQHAAAGALRCAGMPSAVKRTSRRQSPQETRRQILEAALEALRERSFRELSIDAVMSRTGHTRTVFYRHFDGIPGLMLALIQDVGAELVDVAEQWSQTDRVGPEEARARLRGFVDFYVRNGAAVQAVAEAAHHDAAVEAAYGALVEGFVAVTVRTIEARIASGALEPLDAEQVGRALVRMLNAYLLDTLGRGSTTDPERVLEAVSTVWSRTLFPPT